MHQYAVVEKLAQPVLEIRSIVLTVDVIADIPIAPGFKPTVFSNQVMARKQLMDVLEKSLGTDRVLEGQIFRECAGIGFDVRQERKQRFDLGREIKNAVDGGIVERLDAEAVARCDQTLTALVEQHKGKHAAQARQKLLAMNIVTGEDAFGVRRGAKRPSIGEGRAQLAVIVDFTVMGDDRSVRPLHGLRAGRGEIDNGEPAMRQAAVLVWR